MLARTALLSGGALLAVGTLTSCSGTDVAADGKLEVLTSSYSTTYVAEAVVGDAGTVVDLLPSGGEAHDLELSPRQVAQVQEAAYVFYLGDGFQPSVEQAVAQRTNPSFDGMDAVPGEQYRDSDPHVWLSPTIMATMGDQLAEGLAEVDPEHADLFAGNAAKLRSDLEGLDAEYVQGLAGCQGAMLLTSHEAFGYLADEYGLEQAGIMGINPEAEPSPKRLQEIQELAKETGAGALFIESTDSSGQKLADSLGMKAVPLHTLEVQPEGLDYLEAMRENLTALQEGLACSS